mgnify:FL=1
MNRDQKKQAKELAEAILKLQGRSYDDWLAEQHQQLLLDNADVIAAALTDKHH